jgi:hypothetical protein
VAAWARHCRSCCWAGTGRPSPRPRRRPGEPPPPPPCRHAGKLPPPLPHRGAGKPSPQHTGTRLSEQPPRPRGRAAAAADTPCRSCAAWPRILSLSASCSRAWSRTSLTLTSSDSSQHRLDHHKCEDMHVDCAWLCVGNTHMEDSYVCSKTMRMRGRREKISAGRIRNF